MWGKRHIWRSKNLRPHSQLGSANPIIRNESPPIQPLTARNKMQSTHECIDIRSNPIPSNEANRCHLAHRPPIRHLIALRQHLQRLGWQQKSRHNQKPRKTKSTPGIKLILSRQVCLRMPPCITVRGHGGIKQRRVRFCVGKRGRQPHKQLPTVRSTATVDIIGITLVRQLLLQKTNKNSKRKVPLPPSRHLSLTQQHHPHTGPAYSYSICRTYHPVSLLQV